MKKQKTSEEQLLEEIRKLGQTNGLNEVFTRFLELTALSLSIEVDPINAKQREEEYQKLAGSMDEETLGAYGRMTFLLAMVVFEHWDDPKDILGDLYSRLKLHNEWAGQFFTPDNVSRMMAEMLGIEGEISGSGYLKVNEPTCGSGVMLIASAWAMQRKGIDYRNRVLFMAQDLDIRCVWMAYIQCCLYQIPAVITHGNSLTGETFSYWYTEDGLRVLSGEQEGDCENAEKEMKFPKEPARPDNAQEEKEIA